MILVKYHPTRDVVFKYILEEVTFLYHTFFL